MTQELSTNVFQDSKTFDHVQRVAKVFASSDMVPKQFQNNISNCIIALEMAMRMNASPMMVMQNIDIIHGKPGFSSKFLIASINACGRFSALNYEHNEENGGSTRAYATDLKSGEICYGAWVNMNMAKAEGWIDKNGSKWKTMPELMRNYRAAAFFQRQFAPELTMGLHTSEEIRDTPYEEISSTVKPTSQYEVDKIEEDKRLINFINSCKNLEKLEECEIEIDKSDEDNHITILFNQKYQELKTKNDE